MSDGVKRAVQPQRQADPDDRPQHRLIHPVGQKGKPKRRVLPAYVKNAEQPGAVHGDDRRQRGSRHIHVKARHEHQIQNHIHHAGNHQKQKRRPAVPQSPQDSRVHVVPHISQRSPENNRNIGNGRRPGVLRHLHDFQNQRPDKLPGHRKRNGTHIQKENRCLHNFSQLLLISVSRKLGHQYGYPRSNSQKNTEQQLHRLTARPHRSQRCGTAEIADHHRINRAVKLLQHISGTDRQCESQHFPHDGSLRHIHFRSGFHFDSPSSFSSVLPVCRS